MPRTPVIDIELSVVGSPLVLGVVSLIELVSVADSVPVSAMPVLESAVPSSDSDV